MKRFLACCAAWLCLAGPVAAQERPFCPAGGPCTDDTMEVVFPVGGATDNSVFEYAEFVAGTTIGAGVVIEAVSNRIQGWSLTVVHDDAILTLADDAVTTAGTVVDDVFAGGFNATDVVPGGFFTAIVLSFLEDATLPVGRSLILTADYTLSADAGEAGTLLRLASGEIGPVGSPTTDINLTIDGRAFLPRLVTDGIVRKVVDGTEICDNGIDDDGDGLVDAEDPDCQDCICPGPGGECADFAFLFGADSTAVEVDARAATQIAISSTNIRPLLGFQLGVSAGDDRRWTFSGELGTDDRRLIELLMTDVLGGSITPLALNTALVPTNRVDRIERGAAVAGFVGGDFLEYDLDPLLGGPGFLVGYVSDLNGDVNRIPATLNQGASCAANELLIIHFADTDCPDNAGGFGLYWGSAATTATASPVDGRLPVSCRNSEPLLGFQFGAKMLAEGNTTRLVFSGEVGTDDRRLIEPLFTNSLGDEIFPATPNDALIPSVPINRIERGSTIVPFTGGDFFQFDLDPALGGPGFFVGYVSDLDGNVNQIPVANDKACLELNEIAVIILDTGPVECPDNGLIFGSDPTVAVAQPIGNSYRIFSRNSAPLLGVQFGVSTAGNHVFSSGLGTDKNRLVEMLFTDNLGNSITPLAVNSLSTQQQVIGLERGAAIAPFQGDDFFEFDLAPGVGGPGYFLGYVTDLDGNTNVIPANPKGDECVLNELIVVRLSGDFVCPENGFAFGADEIGVVPLGAGTQFSITGKSVRPLLGFQLGVAIRPEDQSFAYSFSSGLGTDKNRLVELLMTDIQGNSLAATGANTLSADSGTVLDIERGAVIAPFAGGDFFDFDLAPGVGGPGFFVGYVTDLDDNVNQIPVPTGGNCPLGELLVVTLARVGDQPFFRADANGNGRLNVSDAVIIINDIVMNFERRFVCDDMLDVNDDEVLDVSDALPLLAWLFQRGPDVADPFFACDVDPTPGAATDLGCAESNCQQ